MALRKKTTKPLGFLPIALALSLSGAISLPALASITDGKSACVEDFAKKLKKLDKADLTKIDPNAYCAASQDAENNKAPDPATRKKLKLGQGEESGTSYPGACHSSYEAVQVVYKNLLENRKVVCEKIYTELNEKFPECLKSKPAESCKNQIDEMAKVYSAGKKQLQEDINSSIKFLKPYPEYNAGAKKGFEKDLRQLQSIIRGGNRQDLLTQTATPPDAGPQVVATAQGSLTLGEYLTKLETRNGALRATASTASGITAPPALSPIDEQEEAKKFVFSFSKKLEDLKAKEAKDFDIQLKAFRESLVNKLGPATDGFTGKIMKYGPAAAPLASTFLSNGGAAQVSSIASSSGALPALAAVGVAGAAGIAMGQKSAQGASAAPPSLPTIGENNKTLGTEFGGNPVAQTPSPTPNTPGSPRSEEEEKGQDAPLVATGNPAMAAAIGGGASSMPGAMKPKSERETASAAPATGAGDEALKPFTGDLRPSPRPGNSPDSAGNDVSNLLGKMKDLFNMDDTFDIAPPPMDMNASRPSGGGESAYDYAGDEFVGNDEYQADGEYSEQEQDYQGSDAMGDIEINLFRRVHARHVKCMEKGLVLLISQELPE